MKMKLRLILSCLLKTTQVFKTCESNLPGIATSAGHNRHKQEKVEESGEVRKNYYQKGLKVEGKQYKKDFMKKLSSYLLKTTKSI